MEIKGRIEKCDSKVQWDEFVLQNGGHPLQLWGWGDAKDVLGWQVDRIFVVQEDKQIGAAQILVKKLPKPLGASLYIPRGPVIVGEHSHEVYSQLIDYVKTNYRAVSLVVEPDSEDEPSGEGWIEQSLHSLDPSTLLLDLSKADGVLLAEMDQATREKIRHAATYDITVKKLTSPEDVEACVELYRSHTSERGEKVYKETYYRALEEKMGDFSALFGAYENDTLVAFSWLMLSESVALELYDGESKRGKEIEAAAALRWDVIRRVKHWGIPTYDIGGLGQNAEGSSKAGFGALTTKFVGTFVLPLSPLYGLWARTRRAGKHFLK